MCPRLVTVVLCWSSLLVGLTAMGCGRIGFDPLDLASGDVSGNGGEAGDSGAAGGEGGAGGAAGGSAGGTGGAGNLDASTGGSSAGGASTGGADSGIGGADACSPCADPTGLSLSDSTVTSSVGGPGGAAVGNTCPEDEVVIGYTGMSGDDGAYTLLMQIATVCGKPVLSGSGPYSITVAESRSLATRGMAGTVAWVSRCPADQVVVGFDSNADAFLMELSPICAPLVVTGSPGSYSLSIGPTVALPPAGGPSGTPQPTVLCPAGSVARGSPLRSGLYVDRFSLSCATPKLTYPIGTACATGTDCVTGVCTAGMCAPSACVPTADCTCALYDGRDFAFCTAALSHPDARTACAGMGLRLARLDDAVEDGWVSSTATLHGMQWFWLGGDALAVPDEWRWEDGTLFWTGLQSGTSPPGMFTNWVPHIFGPTIASGCVDMAPVQHWESRDCSETWPYACERY